MATDKQIECILYSQSPVEDYYQPFALVPTIKRDTFFGRSHAHKLRRANCTSVLRSFGTLFEVKVSQSSENGSKVIKQILYSTFAPGLGSGDSFRLYQGRKPRL